MFKKLLYLFLIFLIMSIVILLCSNPKITLYNTAWAPLASENSSILQKEFPNYAHPVESTYFTFPEWYIVYNSQEYADYLKNNLPSGFPYFTSLSQYWGSYNAIKKITQHKFPFNKGDNLMLAVIGTSFSMEYIFKGFYENTIGRISELSSGKNFTAEDRYAQKVSLEYAHFIPTQPWFDFPFYSKLTGLWQETPFWGPHMLRKLERKFILSTEYIIKSIYAGLIRAGSHLTYGVTGSTTYVVIDQLPKNFLKNNATIHYVKKISPHQYLITLPREQPFTDAIEKIAKSGVKILAIAGNKEILLTFVTTNNWHNSFQDSQILFKMPVLTKANQTRVAVRLPVNLLLPFVASLNANGIAVEHIYDY